LLWLLFIIIYTMKSDKCDIKLCGVTTLGPKWQVVIPKEIRDTLQIDTGDSLAVLMKHWKYIGLVKNEDVSELMDYINNWN